MKRCLAAVLLLTACESAPLPEIAALESACTGGDAAACAALPQARQSVMAAYGGAFQPIYLTPPQTPVKVIVCDPRVSVCY